jgi:hypothetical protein
MTMMVEVQTGGFVVAEFSERAIATLKENSGLPVWVLTVSRGGSLPDGAARCKGAIRNWDGFTGHVYTDSDFDWETLSYGPARNVFLVRWV